MKTALYLLPVIFVSVSFLVYLELFEKRKQIFFVKPFSTVLVIITALLSLTESGINLTYTIGVTAGLIFSLGGDIALMFQDDKKLFRIGLVLFLLAHIVYAAIFTIVGTISGITLFTTIAVMFTGILIYSIIRKNLGQMKIPVIAYIIIISLMIVQATSVYGVSELKVFQASIIFTGALLFYISDVMLATNRFFRPWRYNRISLAFYYCGQTLIALSASFF